jgi:pullulanase
MIHLISFEAQTERFTHYPVYHGTDLGLIYSPEQSSFRIWAPTADELQLLLYKEGNDGSVVQTEPLLKDENGTWLLSLPGNWKGYYYTLRACINGMWSNEVPDPYARCTGINGKRAMIIDNKETDPVDWENDRSPAFSSKTDAIIYELHIRDASIALSSGIINKGKYKGLTETGTVNTEGLSTGLDHLKEMGITHIHLLPFYDFHSIDETHPSQYNWGYDPQNYNVPEGSYATNPYDGPCRIKELKAMIKAFHENGLRVIMDVTYNHTMPIEESLFDQLVPGYYYRQTADGELSNASACGNETASERAMMRKFIVESVVYWTKEYHIDGFRFDLMGVMDITTMNLISKELQRIKPDILLYGEGWAAGTSPLPESLRAIKANVSYLDKVAVFSDDIRDGIKGNVFDYAGKGFVSNEDGLEESIKFGVTAACPHPQINYDKVNYSKAPYATQPWQTIAYADCHDNHTLWDKLTIAAWNASEEERKEMHKLALSIVLTSQGITFLHAGTEFLRSKKGNANSYKAGDAINEIDWDLKTKNKDVFEYVKTLIKIRKTHPAFRMRTADQIRTHLRFEEAMPSGLVSYTIDGAALKDTWRKIKVYYNGSNTEKQFILDSKRWSAAILNNTITNGQNIQGIITLKPYTCTILYLQIPE